jgi:glycosyltransferase involved in cell wall biosynthesis
MTSTLGRPIRVAHVIETLGTGGAEKLLAGVVERLDRAGFASRVIPLEEPLDLKDEIEAAGVEVDPVLVSPRRHPVACVRGLARRLRAFSPDVVHTHLHYANLLGRVAARLAGGPPVVTTLHNPDYTFESRDTVLFRARKRADRWTGARNAATVAVSQAVADDYRGHMGWDRIRVIPNGVDLDAFSPGDDEEVHAVWPGPGLRLLTVGRLFPQKGHGVLIDAMARARDRGAALSLVIAGDGALRHALQEDIRRRGLEGGSSGRSGATWAAARACGCSFLPPRVVGTRC